MFSGFLRLEIKNSIKAVRNTLAGLIIVLLILTVALAAVSFVMGRDNAIKPLKTAVVMHDDDAVTKMLVRYVSQLDSIKSVSEFVTMDEDEAQAALYGGEVGIVIELPEDFYNDVNYGRNTPIKVFMGKDPDLIMRIFLGVVRNGVGYVQTTESAVYAFIDIASQGRYELKDPGIVIGDHIAGIYANKIMRRLRLVESTVVSEYGELGMPQFAFSAFMLIYLLYAGSLFAYLYRDSYKAIEDKLKIFGVGRFKVALIKETVMTLHLFIQGMFIYLIAWLIQGKLELSVVSLSVGGVIAVLLTALCIAVMYNALYSYAGDGYEAQAGVFLILILSVMAAGIVIPYTHMPAWVKYLGMIDPLTYMKKCFDPIFYGYQGGVTAAVILVAVMAVMQAAGVICRRR